MYENQITALLGQNGAGKSTAINILTGSTRPTGGYAHVYGLSVTSAMDRIRAIMGVCPQVHRLKPGTCCLEPEICSLLFAVGLLLIADC